jgi:glycosyltransferase involved in cell wall biosynthesis
VAVSSEIEEWLLAFVARSRVTRIWNGIADPASRIGIRPWTLRPLRVGVLGRLTPVKRFERALEAVARCRDVQLDVVGDGPERAFLERRARELDLGDRVTFLGHLADPLDHLANWRALLVTSLHEGNPMSVIEAMALGTPVLCGALPGVEEMIEGGAGWRVSDPDNAASWGSALDDVSKDARGGLASVCARESFLRDFTSDRCAEQLFSVYRAVSAKRSQE